jgi:hypothetical protein
MARLTDLALLELFREALSEWPVTGYVVWKRRAAEWLRANLAGQTQKSVTKLMYDHLLAGGEIDQVREQYGEYADRRPYHYDFRFEIDGRRIYIETVLDSTRTGPTVTVVNMKYA